MKQLFYLFVCGLATSFTFSQVTLDSASISPRVGETVKFYYAPYVDQGAFGADITWDFSTLVLFDSIEIPYTSASGSSSINIIENHPNYWYGYHFDSTGWYYSTYSTTSSPFFSYTLSNSKQMMVFPLTYNTTNTDLVAGSYYWDPYTYTLTGSYTLTADAYGTLITPAGTFENTIRVHTVDLDNRTSSQSNFHYKTESYTWYADGYHSELASSWKRYSSGTLQSSGFYYLDSITPALQIGEINKNSASPSLFPNPASGKLSVLLSEQTPYEHFRILDQVGRPVLTGNISKTQFDIDVTSFDKGIYYISFEGKGEHEVQKLEVN